VKELDPAELSTSDRYKLLVGCVTPRPIAFVSSVSPEGKHNLAPFSFFNAAGADPMTLLFCPVTTPEGGKKDTLRNVVPPEEGGVGQFVVNVAVEAYARQVSAAAALLPYGESEFEMARFTPAPSRVVRPPRVAESPVSFACGTTHAVRRAPGGPARGMVVMGRVVHVWIREDLVNDRLHVDPDRLATIGRMGGPEYCRTRERFALPRGEEALRAAPPFETDRGTALLREEDPTDG